MPTKTPSIISVVLTVIVLILLGLFMGFMSLVALNGFSEREGAPALITFGVCVSIGIILSAVLAGRLTKLFIAKYNWNSILAVAVALLASTVLGIILYAIAFFLEIVIADVLWNL
jgi:MFS family permease